MSPDSGRLRDVGIVHLAAAALTVLAILPQTAIAAARVSPSYERSLVARVVTHGRDAGSPNGPRVFLARGTLPAGKVSRRRYGESHVPRRQGA